MICSELMSNKFDFNKVTFKTYVHQIVLNSYYSTETTLSRKGQQNYQNADSVDLSFKSVAEKAMESSILRKRR